MSPTSNPTMSESWVIDSRWGWIDQTKRLNASKGYDVDDDSDDDE
jgi:hypothetical protein